MEEMKNMYGDLGIHRPKLLLPGEKFNYNGLLPTGPELFNYLDRDQIINGIFDLFKDPNVCKYNSEKRLLTLEEVNNFFLWSLNEQKESKSYNYHIINSKFNIYIGIIQNISYLGIQDYYPFLLDYIRNIKKSWVLEFYSIPKVWGVNLMSHMLNEMLKVHVNQGYREFYALVNPKNERCIKFLFKAGFRAVRDDDNIIVLTQNKAGVIGAVYCLVIKEK
jgi:RimJ/RimL family protein N-acetyltransferase